MNDEYQDLPLFRDSGRDPDDEPATPELPSPTRFETLAEAQEWLAASLRDGVECPCCGQTAKVYKRPLHSKMAKTMILFYRESNRRPGDPPWLHMLDLFKKSQFFSGDYGHLVHWGMLEAAAEKKGDGNPKNGQYRITDNGRLFTIDRLEVPKYAFLYKRRLLGFSAEKFGVRAALGTEFNYSELMSA